MAPESSRDTLAEDFFRYLEDERNVSQRTVKAYRQALTAFRAFNATPWKQCNIEIFRDYLFDLMKRKQARSYVRLQFSALRTFYSFLVARKKLRIDPLSGLQLPKLEKKLPLVLTRQQIDELLAAPLKDKKNRAAPTWMPRRDVAIMELFYSSGLRLSELAAWTWQTRIFTPSPSGSLVKGERKESVRWGYQPWNRFRAIVRWPVSTPVRFSSTSRAGACHRARSG